MSHYHELPDDWTLLVTDVVGSTKAIAAGKYKDVNMVGAASIITAINVSDGLPLPFVFGGDGSLIAVPPNLLESAVEETRRLQNTSQEIFCLKLRAAAIPVSALSNEGANTLVCKYNLSEGNNLAMFAGGGPKLAESWLKGDDTSNGYALLPRGDEGPANLEGLSCRWQPLKAQNGTMLTLILVPKGGADEEEIIKVSDKIQDILAAPMPNFAPANKKTLRFKFPPRGLPMEIAAQASSNGWLKASVHTYITAFCQYLCESFGITIGGYNGSKYRDEIIAHSDYRKFDGSLRMVLDVSDQQAAHVISFLEDEHNAGKLCFGTWLSKEALMTCLLFSLEDKEHIHFIDGSNGGYAMAAERLKKQLLS